MCDYSLHHVATRPARVGDKLVTTSFPATLTRGFAAVDEPGVVAVCLLPGSEIAFDREIEYEGSFVFGLGSPNRKNQQRVARFRQIDTDNALAHHDALEFPDGQVVLLTRLVAGNGMPGRVNSGFQQRFGHPGRCLGFRFARAKEVLT